jgi:hypothetical protein
MSEVETAGGADRNIARFLDQDGTLGIRDLPGRCRMDLPDSRFNSLWLSAEDFKHGGIGNISGLDGFDRSFIIAFLPTCLPDQSG